MYYLCQGNDFLLLPRQIQELKRKARQSPGHGSAKKGESPVVSRKISDTSPKNLRKVGPGGTPAGSPAENRSDTMAGWHTEVRGELRIS